MMARISFMAVLVVRCTETVVRSVLGNLGLQTFYCGSTVREIGRVHRIICKLDRVVGFEPLLDVSKPVLVIFGGDVQGSAEGVLTDLAFLHDYLACLDDEPRQLKHGPAILLRSINGDIGIAADS